jgi:hypothetical protein
MERLPDGVACSALLLAGIVYGNYIEEDVACRFACRWITVKNSPLGKSVFRLLKFFALLGFRLNFLYCRTAVTAGGFYRGTFASV